MKKPVSIISAFALCSLLGVCEHSASAARRSNAIGMSMFMNFVSCFGWDTTGGNAGLAVSATTACSQGFLPPIYIIPIHLDSTGAKTVKLTVKQTVANQLSCSLAEYSASAALVQSVPYSSIPVGSYTTLSKNITVTTGDSLNMVCSFNMAAADIASARILTVEY
jgi:hypothetical protein